MGKQTSSRIPGVYIDERNSVPNSPMAVPTAIPAFVGYTPSAQWENESLLNVPTKICSWLEFEARFGFGDLDRVYPQFYIEEIDSEPTHNNFVQIGLTYYEIKEDFNCLYYFYNSIKLFYENGGEEAFIVSVGTYSKPPQGIAAMVEVNKNVSVDSLVHGLSLLKDQSEPSMYICPDATVLTVEDNAKLMKVMLAQAGTLKRAVCLFDVLGARKPDPILFMKDIERFREGVGTDNLSYGVSYFPFLRTDLVDGKDVNYQNFFGYNIAALSTILHLDLDGNPALDDVISEISEGNSQATPQKLHASLLDVSPLYTELCSKALAITSILPPTAALAGIMTQIDNDKGVWKAPANVGLREVNGLTLDLTAEDTGPLNIDAIWGKSVNAIRYFSGMGILVWGARTLDGNSLDYGYVNMRRTLIFLEQSCLLALKAYVFEPNTENTWTSVKATLNSFLTTIWNQGGLQGSTPEEAFTVYCGLGITMTALDVSEGILRVTIKVALVRPAEFIVLTFQQQQEEA